METQAALVRAKRGVELNAEATVDMNVALVVGPRNTENQLTLRLTQALNEAVISVVRILIQDYLEGIQDLEQCLVELWLTGVALEELVVVFGDLLVDRHVGHLSLRPQGG